MLKEKLLIVVSGPSGAGKGTLCKELMRRSKHLKCSISATSRDKRVGEIDGENYHYLAKEDFLKKVKAKDFLEYAEVYGNYYGTLKEEVLKGFADGYDVILEIDIQGALQIKKNYPEAICIFVMPPSFAELKERIVKRERDTLEDIQKRMVEVAKELKYISEYDYVIINDYVDEATSRMEAIVIAEKCRLERSFIDIESFIKE